MLSGVLTTRPTRLTDYPRPEDRQQGVVTDSDDEAQEEEDQKEEDVETGDPVSKALVQLTKIVGSLAKSKKKEKGLEETLDQVGEGSGLGDVSSSMGRKHAAARQPLLKAFKQDPKLIWQTIERNMAEDFHLRSSLPSSGPLTFSARGWCRSRIAALHQNTATGLGNCWSAGQSKRVQLRSGENRWITDFFFCPTVSDGAGSLSSIEQLPGSHS